jgi:hypothetical protein
MNLLGRWITTVESPHHTRTKLWISAALIQPLPLFSVIFSLTEALCRPKRKLAMQLDCEAIPAAVARPGVDTEHQAATGQCKWYWESRLRKIIHSHLGSILLFFFCPFLPLLDVSLAYYLSRCFWQLRLTERDSGFPDGTTRSSARVTKYRVSTSRAKCSNI